MLESEIIDLVSEDDSTVIGTIDRVDLYEKGLSNFRVVNGLIVKKNGQIWIPRRKRSKKLFPLALDSSIGGHVKSGESYLDAFVRESIEETSIDPRKESFKFLTKLTPQKDNVSAFMHVYVIQYEEEVLFNPLDFEECYWMFPEEILQKIDQGERAKSDLTKIITSYISYEKIN